MRGFPESATCGEAGGRAQYERPFPLTPALSLGERENRIPFRDKSERSLHPTAGYGAPSLGERVGVTGNASYSNPTRRVTVETVKPQESSSNGGGSPT